MNNFNLKRNKIFRVLPVILALSLLACGCGANTDKAENEPQKNDAVVSIVPDTAQTNEDQQVSVKSGESFYKLQVQEAVLDESAVLAAWIPSFDAGQVSSTTTSEGNAKQTTLSGITYCWTMNGNSFDGYTDALNTSTVGEETARQLGGQFVKALGFEVSSTPSVSKDELGRIILEYSFQYEGVDILGNKILYIGQTDEAGTHGTYIALTIDDSGICGVCISNLMQISSSVTTYQKAADFIGDEQAMALAESYYDQLMGKEGAYSALGGRTELNIIYMPYLENGKNMLIPVYEVSVLNTDGDPMFCAVLDALTGYVYSAQ